MVTPTTPMRLETPQRRLAAVTFLLLTACTAQAEPTEVVTVANVVVSGPAVAAGTSAVVPATLPIASAAVR